MVPAIEKIHKWFCMMEKINSNFKRTIKFPAHKWKFEILYTCKTSVTKKQDGNAMSWIPATTFSIVITVKGQCSDFGQSPAHNKTILWIWAKLLRCESHIYFWRLAIWSVFLTAYLCFNIPSFKSHGLLFMVIVYQNFAKTVTLVY